MGPGLGAGRALRIIRSPAGNKARTSRWSQHKAIRGRAQRRARHSSAPACAKGTINDQHSKLWQPQLQCTLQSSDLGATESMAVDSAAVAKAGGRKRQRQPQGPAESLAAGRARMGRWMTTAGVEKAAESHRGQAQIATDRRRRMRTSPHAGGRTGSSALGPWDRVGPTRDRHHGRFSGRGRKRLPDTPILRTGPARHVSPWACKGASAAW